MELYLFIIGFLLTLKIAKQRPINNPKINDADNSFRVIKVALSNLGKLVIINSKSINNPYCILLLIY